jgi:hypothetical protein
LLELARAGDPELQARYWALHERMAAEFLADLEEGIAVMNPAGTRATSAEDKVAKMRHIIARLRVSARPSVPREPS